MYGMGFPFLKAASESYEKVCELVETVVAEMKVAMQLTGSSSIARLHQADVVVTGETRSWLILRGFEADLTVMAQRRWRRMMHSLPDA